MNNKYKFAGKEARNIGRFGWVVPGTVLELTDGEIEGIAGNPEWKAAPKGECATDPLSIAIANVMEMSRDDLKLHLDIMTNEGYPCAIRQDAETPVIRALLVRCTEMGPAAFTGYKRKAYDALEALTDEELNAVAAEAGVITAQGGVRYSRREIMFAIADKASAEPTNEVKKDENA